ncbi:glycosyltransferase family 4 protein [Synechococcus sp. MIT S9504]|uniref:glycosyltransferase family 4 protein n=1 Tax=Synechococcus sp. MIT S9504 TaxID=1801628 RepID=UPI0007BC0C01|nr:glycosyltransferase family 4 protein [Synechococcus sp. MIT S9504]KZR84991.1 N,N'-diacetylbacillosaminyl-diphospho-undecaprenol alpha-1,3-N-acetylgalactosaminyltransferase [Synechococcus sp. MIT S9504]
MKIFVLAGFSRSLVNFRGPLLTALRNLGHEVIAAAPADNGTDYARKVLARQGIRFEVVPFARGGINPFCDYLAFLELKKLLRNYLPDMLISYTIKPVIYGGFACNSIGNISFVPTITGLGYVFTEGNEFKRRLIRALVQKLYRKSLKSAKIVIFQNPDDERFFRDRRLIAKQLDSVRVYGSGVDMDMFPPVPLPSKPGFLMLARLLVDKGVRDYVKAAKIVKARFPAALFQLAGAFDPNPSGVTADEVDSWSESGVLDYLGDVENVQPLLASCRFYVLPSFREGTPRSVLEALATGRPVITTDVPGCRETVDHGINGLLVPPRNAYALAGAMIQMLEAPESEVQSMSYASLALAKEYYDVHKVNSQLLEVIGA